MISFIETEHFKKLDCFRADLTEGTNLILGDNGMGKTTLFNVVRFALYGTAAIASNAENIPTWGSKNCKVKVGFTNDFLVVRTLKDCKIYEAGEGGSLTEDPQLKVAEGNKPCTEWVKEHLGLDHKMFSIFNMSMQGETGALITLGATELNRIVENFSGVGVLDVVIKSLSKENSRLEGAVGTVEHTNISEREAEFDKLTSDISQLSVKVGTCAESVNVAKLKENEKATAYHQGVTHNQTVAEQETKKAAAKAVVDEVLPQTVSLNTKVTELKAQVNDNDLEKSTASIAELETNLKDFNSDSSSHTSYETQRDHAKSSCEEYHKKSKLEEETAEKIAVLNADISEGVRVYEELNSISGLVSQRTAFNNQAIEHLEAARLEEETAVKKAKLALEVTEATQLVNKHYEAYLQAKGDYSDAQNALEHGSCEKCQRPFENFNEEIAAELVVTSKADFEEAEENYNSSQNGLHALNEAISNLPNYGTGNAEKAELCQAKVNELETVLNTFEFSWTTFTPLNLTVVEDSVKAKREELSLLPNYGTGNAEKARQYQVKVIALEETISAIEAKWEDFDDEAVEEKLQNLRQEVQAINLLKAKLSQYSEDLASAVKRYNEAFEVFNTVKVEERKDVDALLKEREVCSATTAELTKELGELAKNLNDLEVDCKLEKADLDRIRTDNEKFASYSVEIDQVKRLMKFLRDKRTDYMEGVWSLILGAATGWINKTTQGWITAVGRNPNGDFTFTEKGIIAPVYSEASGAQKEFIGVALRIGLGMSLQGDSAMLMLDEPTAGMTEENSDKLATGLLGVSGQKIIITHRQSERLTAANVINL